MSMLFARVFSMLIAFILCYGGMSWLLSKPWDELGFMSKFVGVVLMVCAMTWCPSQWDCTQGEEER